MLKVCLLAVAMCLCSVAVRAEDRRDTEASAETAVAMENVDLEAAEKLFARNCRACHGNKAQGVASYPGLNDKTPEYIAEKLKIYRSGERVGPNSVLMIQNARDLSDDEIAGLAVYVTTAFD